MRCLVLPPDPTATKMFMRVVPDSHRSFDADRDVWQIWGVYWLSVREVLCGDLGLGPVREYASWTEFEGAQRGHRTKQLTAPNMEAYEELFLLPAAPREVVEAAYRALARLYHPDRGGDHKRMARINAARATIVDKYQVEGASPSS
ncbi:MAG: J domain-containing protein [Dehalococcoidia bacterium]